MRRRFTVTETQRYFEHTMPAGTKVHEVHYSEASSRLVQLLKQTRTFNGSVFFVFEGKVRVAKPGSKFLEET